MIDGPTKAKTQRTAKGRLCFLVLVFGLLTVQHDTVALGAVKGRALRARYAASP